VRRTYARASTVDIVLLGTQLQRLLLHAGDLPGSFVMIRVLLADDEPLVRTGIGLILSAEPSIEVVGAVGDGNEALAGVRELKPDVVVMDVRMPGMDGVEATRHIIDSPPTGQSVPAVLVLTTYHADEAVRSSLRAGASGFLLKDAAPDELVSAIHAVAAGEAWLDPAVAKRLLAEFKGRPESPLPSSEQIARLTQREREVLVLLAHGLTNATIANHLFIAEATVKTHVNRLLMKMGLHDRAAAVAAAYRTGLVAADEPLPPRS
jgi:DNA-binding NarL/FixJ family response regulator